MPSPHIYYLSASCPITYLPCIYLKTSMPYSCALTLYSLISVDHIYTMYIPWGIHVPWCHSVSRPFPILLDPKSFQITLGLWHDVMWLPSHMPSLSHCRLIITTTISYLICPKVCPHFCFMTYRLSKSIIVIVTWL